MSDLDLVLLGNRVCEARKQCGLTQQEPANQTGLSVKMIQGIEKGHKNPTYETLIRLIERLGMSPDIAFQSKSTTMTEEAKGVLEYFQLCDPKSQDILLKTLHFFSSTVTFPSE